MKKLIAFMCGAALAWIININVCSAIEVQDATNPPIKSNKATTIKRNPVNQLNPQPEPPIGAKTKAVKKKPLNQLNPQPDPP